MVNANILILIGKVNNCNLQHMPKCRCIMKVIQLHCVYSNVTLKRAETIYLENFYTCCVRLCY